MNDLREWYARESANTSGIRHLSLDQARTYLEVLGVLQYGHGHILPKLLEIGIGDGSFLQYALECSECVGIDSNPKCIKAAQERLGHRVGPAGLVECELSEMRDYPEKFHFIYMIGRVPSEEDRQIIQVLLHRGGRYCVVLPNGEVVTGGKEPI